MTIHQRESNYNGTKITLEIETDGKIDDYMNKHLIKLMYFSIMERMEEHLNKVDFLRSQKFD